MSEIVLSPEQASVLSSTKEPITVLNPDGTLAGWLQMAGFIKPERSPFTPEEVAAAVQAAKEGPWHTTKEVLEHLESLGRSQP
jgi:hypothetical protein